MPIMTRFINRLFLGAIALFVLGTVAVGAYQFAYVIPAKRCETAGRWWDPGSRTCATPIFLPHITGRPLNAQEAAAAASAALPEAQERSPRPTYDPRPSF